MKPDLKEGHCMACGKFVENLNWVPELENQFVACDLCNEEIFDVLKAIPVCEDGDAPVTSLPDSVMELCLKLCGRDIDGWPLEPSNY